MNDDAVRDAEVVAGCLAGRSELFAELVRRHSPRVLAVGRGVGLGWSVLDELTQETFVRAYQRLGELKSPTAFRSWLLGIAYRVAAELRRERGPTREVMLRLLDRRAARDDGDDRSEHQRLTRAVANLPSESREAIVLRYFAGLSCDDAATAAGITKAALLKRLSRAYSLLRGELSEARAREASDR